MKVKASDRDARSPPKGIGFRLQLSSLKLLSETATSQPLLKQQTYSLTKDNQP